MFSNFISLGPSCPVAASMMKFGLRGWAGPFDWLIAPNFDRVLYFIDHEFEGFIEKANLVSYEGSQRKFRDIKSGFTFIHDQEYPFIECYDELRQKYEKKIDRFLKETQKGSCFLRACTRVEDLVYILGNSRYIKDVIKRKNKENEIIFLIANNLKVPEQMPFRYYAMPGRYGQDTLRNFFDGANDFLGYCAEHYSAVSMIRNIAFDRKKEEAISRIRQKRYDTLVKLCNVRYEDMMLPDNIIIYGAGNIGKYFYRIVKGRSNIFCFADKKEAGKEIDGVPVNTLEEIDYKKDVTFVVTATYDFDNIYTKIKEYFQEADILSLDDLLQNGRRI